jgi:hypothetical protein
MDLDPLDFLGNVARCYCLCFSDNQSVEKVEFSISLEC